MNLYHRSPHKVDFVMLCSICHIFKFIISCNYFHSRHIFTFEFNFGFVILFSFQLQIPQALHYAYEKL